jgi:serine/threonine-protein kinase
MKPLKTLVISMVGIAAILAGYVLHNHIVKVKAARMEHAVAPAAFFPAGAIWTKDISHAPLDPQSSTIIAWLADAGGWGNNNKMQIDFGMRVLQEDAATPQVPFRKAPGFMAADSDNITTIPLPAGSDMESCEGDCQLIVVDRSHGKLYETFATRVAENAVIAQFAAVWDLNRV